MPDAAFAQKIGRSIPIKLYSIAGWHCTSSFELTVVSSAEIHLSAVLKNRNSVWSRVPAHAEKVLSVNGSIGPGK
jgi:hypothetical protein